MQGTVLHDTDLHHVARCGDFQKLQVLIENGAEINKTNEVSFVRV